MQPLINFKSEWPDLTKELETKPRDKRFEMLQQLALSFPSLRNANGIDPWNLELLEGFVSRQMNLAADSWDEGNPTPLHAAWAGLFVFSLIDPYDLNFIFVQAMAAFDEPHKEVIRKWMDEPFTFSDYDQNQEEE